MNLSQVGFPTSDNITFNGMLGMLQKREVDLCIYRIAKTQFRANIADFLSPITKVIILNH